MGDSFLHEDVGGESTSGEHCDGRSVGGMGVNDSLVAGHWGRWSMRTCLHKLVPVRKSATQMVITWVV